MPEPTSLHKKIESEAPPGSFSQFDIAVMMPELEKLGPKDVYVEIGVQYGRSLYIAAKYSKAQVFGVDIEATLKEELLDGLHYDYSVLGSEKAAHYWERPISLLFIDGNHGYHACARDIELWTPFMRRGGVILFHDCDESSPGVMKAVEEFYPVHQVCKSNYGNTSMAKVVV